MFCFNLTSLESEFKAQCLRKQLNVMTAVQNVLNEAVSNSQTDPNIANNLSQKKHLRHKECEIKILLSKVKRY